MRSLDELLTLRSKAEAEPQGFFMLTGEELVSLLNNAAGRPIPVPQSEIDKASGR